MLEIIKYGFTKKGKAWVVGHLCFEGLEIIDIFNTNIIDESILKDKTKVKPKLFKIYRTDDKQIHFFLEF